jgi:hypothetical protein
LNARLATFVHFELRALAARLQGSQDAGEILRSKRPQSAATAKKKCRKIGWCCVYQITHRRAWLDSVVNERLNSSARRDW